MKPERRRSLAGGFLPSVLITGLLLYGGLWLTQYLVMIPLSHQAAIDRLGIR